MKNMIECDIKDPIKRYALSNDLHRYFISAQKVPNTIIGNSIGHWISLLTRHVLVS